MAKLINTVATIIKVFGEENGNFISAALLIQNLCLQMVLRNIENISTHHAELFLWSMTSFVFFITSQNWDSTGVSEWFSLTAFLRTTDIEDKGLFVLSHYIIYRKTSIIRRILVGNKIVDHSDVVGAPPVGAAPTTSSFLT